MSLNAIMSSALSALQTNSTALDVVSNNIANVNTTGYAQRVVNEQTAGSGGSLDGVSIADIQRVVNQFLTQQTLSANSSSSLYSAQSNVLSQVNALLGQVGSGTDLPTLLDNVYSALGQASLSTTTNTSQQAVLAAANDFASQVSGLSSSLSTLQNQVDQQVVTDVSSANSYIQQIYNLNQQIQTAVASGNTDSGLLDQRDQVVQSLSSLIGVTTSTQSNGTMLVSTSDGVNLVGSGTYTELSYSGGAANGTYGPIMAQTVQPSTGQLVGEAKSISGDIGSGEIAGLVQMRDVSLAGLQEELGNFAQQTALAFNAQYNANTSYPPPTSLTGTNTGLLSSDALNMTGETNIGITSATGTLVSNVNVDFDNDTLSVDGGASVSFGGTVGGFASALDTALGANGTATFSNGVLQISASGGNGVTIADDAGDPTNAGGVSFSQFFGLNNLFQTSSPSVTGTTLTSADAGGFANGGTIQMQLSNPDGTVAATASVAVTSGMTIGDIVNALNTSFNGAASFSLSSSGQLTMTPGSGYSGDSLQVTSDSTERGSTGMSFSQIFGLGTQQTIDQAASFSVNPAIADGSQALAFAEPQLTSSTAVGATVVSPGDNSGLLALQNLSNAQISFPAAGDLNAQSGTLDSYASSFYQDVATQTTTTTSNATAASDQLTEAQSQQSKASGVDLDTQLSNMILYQQAYSAGARVLQTADQIFTTLMQIQTG